MLLGVGGSGKQSLARLAGFMAGLEIATLTTVETYGPTEFLADIAAMYILLILFFARHEFFVFSLTSTTCESWREIQADRINNNRLASA